MKNLKNLLMSYSLTIIILMQASMQLFCASANLRSPEIASKKANLFAILDVEDLENDVDDVVSTPQSPTGASQFNPTEEIHAAFESKETGEDDQESWSFIKKDIRPKYKTYNFNTIATLEEQDPSKCCSKMDVNLKCFTELRKYAQSQKFNDLITKNDIRIAKSQFSDRYHITLVELNLKINTSSILTSSDIKKLKQQITDTLNSSVFNAIKKHADGMKLTSNILAIFNFRHIVAAFYNPKNPNPICSDFKANLIDPIAIDFKSVITPLIMSKLPVNSKITITNKNIDARPHITLASMSRGYDDKIIDNLENAVEFTINLTNKIYTVTHFDN